MSLLFSATVKKFNSNPIAGSKLLYANRIEGQILHEMPVKTRGETPLWDFPVAKKAIHNILKAR
jgi:hypothetical protein